MEKFDIIVIGSGGGSKITRPAANLGYRVAIIEKDQLGGTCLNRGCLPSKMLIHPADLITELREFSKFHISISDNISVNSKALVTDVNNEIIEESESIEPLYDNHKNITYFHGQAEFIESQTLLVNNQKLFGSKIFIAVGARPRIPAISGLEGTPYWTSTEALKATTLPKSLVIIGGGYIACELGHYFSSFGVKVTFLLRSELLSHQDKDIKDEFLSVFSEKHTLIESVTYKHISYSDNQFSIHYDTPDKPNAMITADQLLIAAGVVPNSDLLNLSATNIKCDSNGFILVDDCLQTSQSNCYAFGDIIGRHQFRHTANFEGQYLFDNVVKNETKKTITYKPVPYAVFSYPQIAGVGYLESDCNSLGIDYIIGKNNYSASGMGMALKSTHGFVKLIFERDSLKLIGAHIVGKEAATMIHMLIAYMVMNATLNDILDTIFIHPALPEIVRNAARNVNY